MIAFFLGVIALCLAWPLLLVLAVLGMRAGESLWAAMGRMVRAAAPVLGVMLIGGALVGVVALIAVAPESALTRGAMFGAVAGVIGLLSRGVKAVLK
jgi:hypothetical protein